MLHRNSNFRNIDYQKKLSTRNIAKNRTTYSSSNEFYQNDFILTRRSCAARLLAFPTTSNIGVAVPGVCVRAAASAAFGNRRIQTEDTKFRVNFTVIESDGASILVFEMSGTTDNGHKGVVNGKLLTSGSQ